MRRQDGGAFPLLGLFVQKKLRAVTELPQSKQGEQQKWKQSPLIVKVQPQIVEPGKGQVLGEPVPTQGKTKPPAIPEKDSQISGRDNPVS